MSEDNKKRLDYWYYLGVIILALIVYLYFALNISLLVIKPSKNNYYLSSSTSKLNLNWPEFKEEAIGINNGVFQVNGVQTELPTASLAKLITALVVLNKYPLNMGQSGPNITISSEDVNLLNYYEANQGSVLKVSLGETLSEYQMLEAMLLPSANNIADSLAIWAYGSLANYAKASNSFLINRGLNNTHVGNDASGFDPSTVSTASDLIKIGQMVENNPVLSNIVSLRSASGFPIVGTIKNVNFLLGQSGIIGIKTGNNNQDPGAYLAVSKQEINNQEVNIYTAVMGAPNLWYALNGSLNLINSIWLSFNIPTSLSKNNLDSNLASYKIPWDNQNIKVYPNQNISFKILNSSKASFKVTLNPISFKTKKNQTVGYLILKSDLLNQTQTIQLKLSSSIKKPPLWWLLLHPSYVL